MGTGALWTVCFDKFPNQISNPNLMYIYFITMRLLAVWRRGHVDTETILEKLNKTKTKTIRSLMK